MTNKFKYKFMCIIIMIALIILPTTVQASQSRSSYFNKAYTLNGSEADNLVAVAQAQLGKTKSQLRYTEAWCADFVSDCAELAGLGSKIPFDGYCQTLYNKIKKAGGKDVSSPQKGDLVFYYCKSCSVHWCHVGIMTDTVNSIEGNYNGKVSSVRGYYSDGRHTTSSGAVIKKYVRPAYSNPQPSFTVELENNAVLSGTSCRIAGTVKNGGTYPGLHLYIDYGWVADTANNQYGNYAFYFDTTKFSNGEHLLGVKLTNEEGFDYTSWYTVYIKNEQPSFTVNLENDATISGKSYRIAGSVKNGGTYPGLHLYMDDDWVADTANNQYGNYAFRIDTTKYSNGKHRLGIKLTNENGYEGTSWYTVYVKNEQPSFTVNLENNDTISGTSYRIAGSVKNGGTYPGLHLYMDDDWVADTANNQYGNYAFRIDTTKYSNGKHRLGIKLTNEDGYENTSWYNVYIKNSKTKKVYYGDLDKNGKITITDLSTVRKAIVGKITLTSDEKKRADVNGDGKVTSTDALLIQQYIMKKIDLFPVERMDG